MLPKLNKHKRTRELLVKLKEQFPNAFFEKGKELPLKMGINKDLIATEFFSNKEERGLLRAALFLYTSTLSYKKALVQNDANRIDLYGNIVAPVMEEHKKHAKECIKIIKEKRAVKLKNKEQAKVQDKKQENNNPEYLWPKITLKNNNYSRK